MGNSKVGKQPENGDLSQSQISSFRLKDTNGIYTFAPWSMKQVTSESYNIFHTTDVVFTALQQFCSGRLGN